jgi:cytochrome P450
MTTVETHAAVSAVLREPRWTSDQRGASTDAGVANEVLSKVLLFMDEPDHSRVRSLVSQAFHARSVEQLRPRMVELTEELLAPLRAAGRFDVIGDFAFPFSVTVICELLGVPAEDRDLFSRFTRDLAVLLDRDVAPVQLGTAAGAALELTAYLVPIFEARRRTPRDDLVSALVAAEDAGDRLGIDELLATVVLLLVAGHETTMNLIGNGLLTLLRNPEQLALLRARPDLMLGAVEELLRFDSPVPVTFRTAREDTTCDGRHVRAGDQVTVRLDAANHDRTVFRSPDVLDVTRDARRHVAFGAGAHYCLGATLARAETQIALAALVAVPDLALAVDEPRWRPIEAVHALEALPISC